MTARVKPTARSRGYHHGDLRAALTATAIQLIGRHGVNGFSLAEAARQAGVSPGAPYRHFPDKESLLAAVGLQAYAALAPRLEAAVGATDDPVSGLGAGAAAYVRFSAEEPALFAALFGAGVSKVRFPELGEAATEAYGSWLRAARGLVDTDEAATDLAIDVMTVAHGHAALLADGQFGTPAIDHLPAVEDRVRRIVTAVLTATVDRDDGPHPSPPP